MPKPRSHYDKDGAWSPKPQVCAKAWAEAERHAARCPADKAIIYAATERFYGPRVEVDF